MSRFSYYRTYYVHIIPKSGESGEIITKNFSEYEYDEARKFLASFGKPDRMNYYGRGDREERYYYEDKTIHFGFQEECQVHPLEV